MVSGIRWLARILIPSAMVAWGTYELFHIWQAGWLWHGYHSAISFFVAIMGALWLVADLREFVGQSEL